jgi:hypothetical protein
MVICDEWALILPLVADKAWSSSHRPDFVVLLAVVVKVPAEVDELEM